MIWIVIIGIIILLIASPVARCAVSHPIQVPVNAIVDLFHYIRYRKWNESSVYGIFQEEYWNELPFNILLLLASIVM